MSNLPFYHVNEIHKFEIELDCLTKEIITHLPDINKRWLNIATSHFQQAFMALERAIERRENIF